MYPQSNKPTIPSSDSRSDLNRNTNEYSNHWKNRFRKTWNYSSQSKVKRFRNIIKKYGVCETEGTSVFDQGFGLGLMLFCFPRSSLLAGVELSKDVVDEVSRFAKLNGYKRCDFRPHQEGKKISDQWRPIFDVVISSHVLEHMTDPTEPLRDLVAVLKPGGLAVLIVPINEIAGEDLNHFFFFDIPVLSKMATCAGLDCIELRETDCIWDLIAPLAYRLQRRPSILLKSISLFVNGITGILPHTVLIAFDCILRKVGCRPRQAFLIGRKPI
jgi:SAM-dependent methyltransferase